MLTTAACSLHSLKIQSAINVFFLSTLSLLISKFGVSIFASKFAFFFLDVYQIHRTFLILIIKETETRYFHLRVIAFWIYLYCSSGRIKRIKAVVESAVYDLLLRLRRQTHSLWMLAACFSSIEIQKEQKQTKRPKQQQSVFCFFLLLWFNWLQVTRKQRKRLFAV